MLTRDTRPRPDLIRTGQVIRSSTSKRIYYLICAIAFGLGLFICLALLIDLVLHIGRIGIFPVVLGRVD